MYKNIVNKNIENKNWIYFITLEYLDKKIYILITLLNIQP